MLHFLDSYSMTSEQNSDIILLEPCVEFGNETNNEIEQIRYLNKGLSLYDKYLRRRLNFQIKNLKNIQLSIQIVMETI